MLLGNEPNFFLFHPSDLYRVYKLYLETLDIPRVCDRDMSHDIEFPVILFPLLPAFRMGDIATSYLFK